LLSAETMGNGQGDNVIDSPRVMIKQAEEEIAENERNDKEFVRR
jgi:hypothetical protein